MSIQLQFVFAGGTREDLPEVKLNAGEAALIPLVGDKVILDDGPWRVLERYFTYSADSTKVTLMLKH